MLKNLVVIKRPPTFAASNKGNRHLFTHATPYLLLNAQEW